MPNVQCNQCGAACDIGEAELERIGKSLRQQHEHHQAEPHSVEISLTAAGKVSGSVKVYDADPEKALERAAAIFDQLRKRFPPAP